MLNIIIISITIFIVRLLYRSYQVFYFQSELYASLLYNESRERNAWNKIERKIDNGKSLSSAEQQIYDFFEKDSRKFEGFLRYRREVLTKNTYLRLLMSGKPLTLANWFNENEINMLA